MPKAYGGVCNIIIIINNTSTVLCIDFLHLYAITIKSVRYVQYFLSYSLFYLTKYFIFMKKDAIHFIK